MNRFHTFVVTATLAMSLGASAGTDLLVLSGGAARAPLSEVIGNFERATGQTVKVEYVPMGRLMQDLERGAELDVLVLTADVLPDAERNGWATPGTSLALGSVGVGLAVREGAVVPDISSPEKLKAVLLAARSIAYIDPTKGTSGKHFAKILRDLGIADAIKGKTLMVDGGYVVESVARGEAEIGVQQITEILPVPGVKLVGPLPDPLQKLTIYMAVRTPSGKGKESVERLFKYLQTSECRSIFSQHGFSVQ